MFAIPIKSKLVAHFSVLRMYGTQLQAATWDYNWYINKASLCALPATPRTKFSGLADIKPSGMIGIWIESNITNKSISPLKWYSSVYLVLWVDITLWKRPLVPSQRFIMYLSVLVQDRREYRGENRMDSPSITHDYNCTYSLKKIKNWHFSCWLIYWA